MPFDENGVKWSCEPCIRGHRSSKCAHFDRLMVSVGKAGRPLSKCPHVEGSCNCKKLCAFMVAIPKGTGCICRPVYKMLLDENGPTPAVSQLPIDLTATGASTSPSPNKIQKSGKKQVKPAPEQLERALSTIPDFQQQAGPNGSSAMTPYVPQAALNGFSYNGANGALPHPIGFPTMPGASNGLGLPEDVFATGACHSDSFPSTMQAQPPVPIQARSSCCSNPSRESANGTKVEQRTHLQNGFSSLPLISSPLAAVAPSTWQGFPSVDGHFSHVSGSSNGIQSVLSGYTPQVLSKNYISSAGIGFDHVSVSQPGHTGISNFTHHTPATSNHGASRSCNCGPKCNCFACPDHPYNDVTVQHVQEMGRIIAQEPQTPEDTESHLNGQSNGTHSDESDTRQATTDPVSHLTSGFDPPTTGSCCGVDDAVLDDDPEAQAFNSVTADHLMIPDAYYTYEYQIGLPGACAGEAGNCQCGPSCSCLGCLTHGNPP
ncbi:hypothetical protein BJY01DRAFT_203816 [Aspergillus pseudoustus]|uniref:Copper-fist domain-containing protein n=1 Tax=Aspergillus pseudoustus TaxID=1810923 RepID=A0ABR4KU78_9EURO